MKLWLRRVLAGTTAFLVLFNLGGALAVRVQATAGDRPPTEEELLSPPSPFRMTFEAVSFTSADGVALQGWFLPGSPTGQAAGQASVLLLPGSGKAGHPLAAVAYGPILVAEGYNVLAFSYRGHGRSAGATFGGTLVSLERLVADAEAALHYLRSRPDVGDQPLGVLGCSLGTGVGLALAARTAEVRALVLDSPWSDLPTSQETQAALRGQGWQNRIPYFWHLLRWWAGLAFQVDMRNTEPLTFMPKLPGTPVFLIHGTEDNLLHPRQAEVLHAQAPGPKQLWMPAGVWHCEARWTVDLEFQAQVGAFFQRWLLGGPGPGFTMSPVVEVLKDGGREVAVTLVNESQESLPVGVTLHRPERGAPPEAFRIWLQPGPGEQTFTFRTRAPFAFAAGLRHYRVRRQGDSWTEDLSADALGWRKMREAETLAAQGKHQEAESAHREAQQLAPHSLRYAFQAGVHFLQRGQYDQALQTFSRLIALPLPSQPGSDPRQWTALAWVYTGRIFDFQGDRSRALAAYRQALEFGIPLATRWAQEGLREPAKPQK